MELSAMMNSGTQENQQIMAVSGTPRIYLTGQVTNQLLDQCLVARLGTDVLTMTEENDNGDIIRCCDNHRMYCGQYGVGVCGFFQKEMEIIK